MSADLRLRLAGIAGLAMVVLSACGGSERVRSDSTGSSTVTPPAVVATSDTPTLPNSLGTPFPLNGPTVAFASAADGKVTVTARSGVASARTRDSATQATLRFAIDGTTRTAVVDLTQPSVAPGGLSVPVFQVNLQNDGVVTTADSNAGTLSYASFGYWAFRPADFPATPGTLQTYFDGRETPVSAMPQTGSATYTGATLGYGAVSGVDFFLTGNVLLNANFTAGGGTIGGQVNTIATFPVSNPMPVGAALPSRIDFTAGSITGNAFSGTASAINTTGAPLTVGTGTFGGKFFGPVVNEVAGQWLVESSTAPAATLRVIGSFGARQ
jgi:transferrin binding protein